jgi:N-acyl-phosphatidylethanolamine-hydrolysing phospholipase D
MKPQLNHEFKKEIRYTWIGHSTAVIQVGQDNLLIDPVFADRCSPSQWFGPKRYREPACSIEQLGRIDIVLVSHDHFDHLDEDALTQL